MKLIDLFRLIGDMKCKKTVPVFVLNTDGSQTLQEIVRVDFVHEVGSVVIYTQNRVRE